MADDAVAGDEGRVGPVRWSEPPDLEIVRASNPGPMTLDGTRSYVFGRERVVIVDPGPAGDGHLAALQEAVGDRPVARILLTHAHADHSGAATAACTRFGAELAASPGTLARLRLPGRALEDGERIELEADSMLTVLHAPGHSADHVCYFAMPGRRLFTGDLVLGTGSSAILYPDGNVAASLASLARLFALRPARLLPGHGPPVDRATAKLEEYRRHRLERERQVEAALGAGASTVPAIREAVYGPLPAGLEWAADASVAAHLAALGDRGVTVPEFADFGSAGESPG